MRPQNFAFLIIAVLTSCTNKEKKQQSEIVNDTMSQYLVSKEKQSYVRVNWTQLKDTTINDVILSFIVLTKEKYDSLSNSKIETEIPLQDFKSIVTSTPDCQLIKLYNGVVDSLCDKHEKSGYSQTYTIKGLWKEKNQLLINFQNWEDTDDFLVDLQDGFIYHLSSEHKLSPSKNFLLGYTNSNLIPLYGNDFMYTKISRDSIKTYFNIDLGQIAVTNLQWLSDDRCLVSAGSIDQQTLTVKNILYYLMKISL